MASDEQIIERIIKGENELYEKLMRKYNDRLFRISMSIINDKAEAKDIMQTTYLNAFLKLRILKNRSGFGTWLTKKYMAYSLQQNCELCYVCNIKNV